MEITDRGVLEGSFMDFTIPTEFAKRALFYIPQYGHFRCDGLYDICRETMSDWLLLACIRRGALYFESDGCNLTAPAGSVVLLDCRAPHRYHCKDEADFLWFHFAGNSTEAYAGLLCEPTCRVFPGAGLESLFQHLFSRMQDIPYSEHLISADVHRLLGRLASPDRAAAGISPVRPALTYIQSHFAESLSLKIFTKRGNFSRRRTSKQTEQQKHTTNRRNFLMNKKVMITGIVCASMLMGVSYAAENRTTPAAELTPATAAGALAAADTAAVVDTASADAPAAEPQEQIPYSIGVKATVTDIRQEEGYSSIEVKPEDGETIVLNLSDETILVDNQAGTAVGLDSIKKGDTIYAYHDLMMTMSIPGQTPALAILTNLGDTAPARLHMPEQVRYLDNTVTALCDNGSIWVSTTAETVFTPYRTRQMVAAQDVRLGHAFLAWYDVVAESYPAQASATRVMILPEKDEPDAVSLILDGDMVIDAQWKDGTVVVPVRTTAEALGLKVGYQKRQAGDAAVITVASETGEIAMTIGEDAYSYRTTMPGAVGATAALPYGAAPYFAPYQESAAPVTWMSAEAFQLLGYDVTLSHNQLHINEQVPAEQATETTVPQAAS